MARELHLIDVSQGVCLDGCADADRVWEETGRIQVNRPCEILEDAVDIRGGYVGAGETREKWLLRLRGVAAEELEDV